MNRAPSRWLKGLFGLGGALIFAIAGCSAEGYLPLAVSGAVGCPPAEITVSHMESFLGLRAWQAECRGRVFQCSNTGRDISCTEMLAPMNGPQTGVIPWQAPAPGAPPPVPISPNGPAPTSPPAVVPMSPPAAVPMSPNAPAPMAPPASKSPFGQ